MKECMMNDDVQKDPRTKTQLLHELSIVESSRDFFRQHHGEVAEELCQVRTALGAAESRACELEDALVRARQATNFLVEVALASWGSMGFWKTIRGNAKALDYSPSYAEEGLIRSYEKVASGLGRKMLRILKDRETEEAKLRNTIAK